MAPQSRRFRHALAVSLAVSLAVGVWMPCHDALAQSAGDDASSKAKLVTTLVRYVEWPAASFESANSPLRLCVQTGSTNIERAFQAYQGTMAGTRTLQIALVPPAATVGCHAMYLDDSAGASSERWLQRHSGAVALTVSTTDGFVSSGGMVEIVHVDNALRFDVNLASLRGAGLGVNPGVLKLARSVRQ